MRKRDSERLKREIAEQMDEFLKKEEGTVSQDIIEIAARDAEKSAESERRLAEEQTRKPESFYSDLIYTLAHIRYAEDEARVVWVSLLTHKWEMSESIGRNVGIRVTALDFFRNVKRSLGEVKIIESSKFVETERLALTDGLTGLFNHRYFQDRLRRDVRSARLLSLLMVDLDYFKYYNDLNGHIAGDVALREVAVLIRRSVKRTDLAARYGGEEFSVVVYGAEKSEAVAAAERLRRAVEEYRFANEEVLPGGRLTVSVGVASLPADAKDRRRLIELADAALYAAKAAGRNCVTTAGGQMLQSRMRLFVPGEGWIQARVLRSGPRGCVVAVSKEPPEGAAVRLRPGGKGDEVRAAVLWRIDRGGGRVELGLVFEGKSACPIR